MVITPAEIKAAAQAYNAEFPEAAAEIEAGEAVVDVAICHADRACSGRSFRMVVNYGVVAPDGGFIGADLIRVDFINRRDGRVSMVDVATRRYAGEAALIGARLIVRNRAR